MSFHETLYRQIAADLGTEAPAFTRVRYEFANGVATVTIVMSTRIMKKPMQRAASAGHGRTSAGMSVFAVEVWVTIAS